MSEPRAPGWALGPLRPLRPAPPLSRARYPAHTRLGVLERLAGAEDAPSFPTNTPNGEPFIGLHEGPLSPWELLAQHAGGCRGLVWRGSSEADARHVLGVARALGMPVWRTQTAPCSAQGQAVALEVAPDGLGELRSVHPDAPPLAQPDALLDARRPALPCPGDERGAQSWAPGVRRVLPWGALPSTPARADAPIALELLWAQAEELALAQEAAPRLGLLGVGLLRMEYILGCDPWMQEDELAEHLANTCLALPHAPVAVRLADWSAEKRPPEGGPLVAWGGARGLQGLPTPTLRAQLRALGAAAEQARHAQVWAVLPHARPGDERRARQHASAGLRVGPMLEDWESLERWREFEGGSDFWIGLGDLGLGAGPGRSHAALVAQVAQMRAEQREVWVCGPPWGAWALEGARLAGGAGSPSA